MGFVSDLSDSSMLVGIMVDQNDWLSLGEAASILGVHPSTVRHWADEGNLPSQRTPGGHRRFRRGDLELWARQQNKPERTGMSMAEVQLVIQNALGRARMEVSRGELSDIAWYQELDEQARREQGALGRRLLDTMSRYLTDNQDNVAVEAEIKALGTEYAQLSRRQGLTLTQTVRAFLFFRDLLIDSIIQLAETLGLNTPLDWGERLRQINKLTNQLLVAIIETAEMSEPSQ